VIFTSNLPSDRDRNSELLLIAVERKKIGDLCACILDGRLLFQLQSSKKAGADVLCLIVEGEIRFSPEDGLLEIPVWGINPRTMRRAQHWEPIKPTMTYSRFDQFLTEMDYLVGVIVKRTTDVWETASVIKALWDNFQKPPDEHQSLKQMFKPPDTYCVADKAVPCASCSRRVAFCGLGTEQNSR